MMTVDLVCSCANDGTPVYTVLVMNCAKLVGRIIAGWTQGRHYMLENSLQHTATTQVLTVSIQLASKLHNTGGA